VNARFYAPAADVPGDVVLLPAEEAQHLTRVLRLAAGDAVRVFNGRGGEFDAVVQQARGGISVRIGNRREGAPEARVGVALAHAVLKGDKMDDVVRDAVMMGAAAIQPMVTTRTEVAMAALGRSRRRERWERIAIASAKQCGRAVVPAVREPAAFGEVVQSVAAMSLPGVGLMFVEPGAASDAVAVSEMDDRPPKEATVLLGPEGGWTPEEIEQASGPCRLVTIGGRTLRADAMAVVALAALFTRWKEF
jgi:16S rRNA (uracil1498-N3)-methyltransferase